MNRELLVGFLALTAVVCAQRRVDPRNTYNRILCVVPLVGQGTPADPKRPEYAPWPSSQNPDGIIAFYFRPTDDGKRAVVEFVARNRAAFQTILNDKTVIVFEKGRVAKTVVEAALKQHLKDFDLDTFGMVMP